MSDTLHIRGLEVERGNKLRTCLPVLDTTIEIPITIINGRATTAPHSSSLPASTAANIPVSRLPWNLGAI